MSKGNAKMKAEKRPPGRPRTTPIEVSSARQRVLWRVRNRALSILAQRHPTEFAQIKEELLAKAGLEPLDEDFARTPTRITLDTGLDDLR